MRLLRTYCPARPCRVCAPLAALVPADSAGVDLDSRENSALWPWDLVLCHKDPLLWVESDQTKYCTEVLKRPISLKFYRNFTSVIDNAIITSKKVAMSSCSAQERKLIVFRRQRPCGLPFCLYCASQRPKREFNDGHKIRVNLHHGKIEDAVARAAIQDAGSRLDGID